MPIGTTADALTTDLSLEFLMGRALDNAMLNVGLKDEARGKMSSFRSGKAYLDGTHRGSEGLGFPD